MTKYTDEQIKAYEELRDKRMSVDPETGCWEWFGRVQSGQATVTIGCPKCPRVTFQVKRFEYLRANLDINIGNKVLKLYNTCNNPNCINPAHLAEGIGIGSATHITAKMASVLKAYLDLNAKGIRFGEIAKQVGVSYATLRKYVEVYQRDPTAWSKLW